VPAGTGSENEYVSLTANPGSLPRVEIEVLSNTLPMTGYENCEKNFVFHGLPACKISLAAGQNPAADLWVFRRENAYFFIYMAYVGAMPVQLFNDFMTSFTFTP
jgi:hypothetical protein